jgi:hypothetical protein
MHGPTNVKSPNNISKWQMGFNSAFKGLIKLCITQIFQHLNSLDMAPCDLWFFPELKSP